MDVNTRRKINVEEALWRQMRARAAERGITVSELVVNAVMVDLAGPQSTAASPAPVRRFPSSNLQDDDYETAPVAAEPAAPPRASTPLEALPDLDEPEDAGLSFGSSRAAPKPAAAPKSVRPFGRRA